MSIDDGLLVELRQRLPDHRREFGIGDQNLGLAVPQDEGDRLRIEANIERVQHRPGHRHPEMRLEGLGSVGRHHRDGVAPPDAARRQRRGQPAAAFERLAPAVPPLAMDDGEPVRIDRRAAQQKADRGQRHVIGRVLVEPYFVRVGRSAHVASPAHYRVSRRPTHLTTSQHLSRLPITRCPVWVESSRSRDPLGRRGCADTARSSSCGE